MRDSQARLGFRVEEISLASGCLPGGAPPLRFAHLSDLHLRLLRRRHERLVAEVNRRRPDFLCLTGDIISRRRATWELCGALVSEFDCPRGVFACPGNWEVESWPRPSVLVGLMAERGVKLLVNSSHTVQTDSGRVCIAGLDDLALGWPDLAGALEGAQGADYTILLSHAPLAARLVTPRAGVNLVLSGHTHGGQVRIPLLWRWMLPSCHGGYADGLYETEWGHLYVSRGFGGAAWMPLRFRCPAEVTFFEIRPT
jgi:predicted MPP superfamily phosphohydrolase